MRAFMRETGAFVASWWLSDRSTPGDVEAQLLACGLARRDDDYLHDGMLLTAEPPRVDGVDVRPIADANELQAAYELSWETFAIPDDRRSSAEIIAREHDELHLTGRVVTYGAWLDGELVGTSRGVFTPRGVLLSGGCTRSDARGRGVYRALVRARWDDAVARGTPALAVQAGDESQPILARLGFETVCRFRRLEDVASSG